MVLIVLAVASCGEITTTDVTDPMTTTEDVNPPVFEGVQDRTIGYEEDIDLLEGITATDPEVGDVTEDIEVTGTVDSGTLGNYDIALSVDDGNGNVAEETFVVTVALVGDQSVDYDLANFTPPELTEDTVTLDLPKYSTNGSWYSWESDNPSVITAGGVIIRPAHGDDPVTVTLTLTASVSGYSDSKEFQYPVQPQPAVTISESMTVPFEGTSEEYVVEAKDAIALYFEEDGNIPYIDVETYLSMIDGAIEFSMLEFTNPSSDQLRVGYTYEYEDFDGTLVEETYHALLDFTDDTFTVNNFDFFSGYVAETTTDYGEGLSYVDADYVDGEEVTIPLGDYHFDMVTYDDGGETQYLMPFHVTNLLFANNLYYDVYYNGDKLWGVDSYNVMGVSEEDQAVQDQIRTSSFNEKDIPYDVRMQTFHFTAMALDYFYGLREDRGVETYYPRLNARIGNLVDSSDTRFYGVLFDLANNLDDLHTSHGFPGFYEDPYSIGLSIDDLGPGVTDWYEYKWNLEDDLIEKFGETPDAYPDMPTSRVIDEGKTGVIYLTGFTVDTPGEFKAELDGFPPSVENVVVDLSYNTGGNLGAVLRIFGYMTEEQILYHSQNPADGSAVTYYIESSYNAYNYNLYIVSSGITFSAANLMTSIAKEMGVATIIGHRSGGGASSIGTVITPDGTALVISTNNVLSTRVTTESGYEYESVEHGIEPDFVLNDVTSDEELIAAIEQDQTE